MSNNTRQCYTPDGTLWEGSTPCNESAEDSPCCGLNDFCLSNGHCLQAQGPFANRIARGSCTDRTWRSPACPFECAGARLDSDCAFFLAYETLNGSFCCDQPFDQSSQSCPTANGQGQNGNVPFNLTLGQIIWNRTDGAIMGNGTLLASEVQQSQAQTTVTLSPSASGSSSSSNVTAVAAGIAVPLGVLLLASLVAIAFLATKLKGAKKELAGYSKTGHDDGMRQNGYAPVAQNGSPSPSPYSPGLPKYQPPQYLHQVVNEAPSERQVVEVDGRMPAHELGS